MPAYLYALIAHGLIGALDVALNHELLARLPRQAGAAPELALHSARELIFGVLFLGLAWYEWHGMAALAIGALLLGELIVSTIDSVLEPAVRLPPPTERAAHVLLFVNMGIIIALLGRTLLDWLALPSALLSTNHGAASSILSAMGVGALIWSVRDWLGAARMRRAKRNGQGERLALVSNDQKA